MKFRINLVLAALLVSACTKPTPPAAPSPRPATPSPRPAPAAPERAVETPATRTGDSDATAAAPRTGGLRPYNRVITRQARTRRGLFAVHHIDDKLFFEIPAQRAEQGHARSSDATPARPRPNPTGLRASSGAYGGDQFGERTLRWERSGNRIILRSPSFDITADTTLSVWHAVEAANYAPIIAVFNVEAYGPDSAAVIDVTRLFTTAIPEIAAIRGADRPDALLHRARARVPRQRRDRGHADGHAARRRGTPAPARARRRAAQRAKRARALEHRAGFPSSR